MAIITLNRDNAIDGNKRICESEFVTDDIREQLEFLKSSGKVVPDDFFFVYVDYHRNFSSLEQVIMKIKDTGPYKVDFSEEECKIYNINSGKLLSRTTTFSSELERAWFCVCHFLHGQALF